MVFNASAAILFRFGQGVDLSAEQWAGTGVIVISALVGSLLGAYFSKLMSRKLIQRVFSVLLFGLATALIFRAITV